MRKFLFMWTPSWGTEANKKRTFYVGFARLIFHQCSYFLSPILSCLSSLGLHSIIWSSDLRAGVLRLYDQNWRRYMQFLVHDTRSQIFQILNLPFFSIILVYYANWYNQPHVNIFGTNNCICTPILPKSVFLYFLSIFDCNTEKFNNQLMEYESLSWSLYIVLHLLFVTIQHYCSSPKKRFHENRNKNSTKFHLSAQTGTETNDSVWNYTGRENFENLMISLNTPKRPEKGAKKFIPGIQKFAELYNSRIGVAFCTTNCITPQLESISARLIAQLQNWSRLLHD